MRLNVGHLEELDAVGILVAASKTNAIGGAVVFFGDMKDYGSGGSASQQRNACGFRLLGVSPAMRGLGLGKQMVAYCIHKAKSHAAQQLIIHTTGSMKVAWALHERMGFRQAHSLDFRQGHLPVYGFRLGLTD